MLKSRSLGLTEIGVSREKTHHRVLTHRMTHARTVQMTHARTVQMTHATVSTVHQVLIHRPILIQYAKVQ
jgi:hypothetical protein